MLDLKSDPEWFHSVKTRGNMKKKLNDEDLRSKLGIQKKITFKIFFFQSQNLSFFTYDLLQPKVL